MSSFSAIFEVNGTKFDVLNCTYSFGQTTDDRGRPSSGVHGGTISLQLVGDDDDSVLGWMVDPYKKTDGKVSFSKIDQDSNLKEMSFKDGYCVGYSESFNRESNNPLTISITISARETTIGNATHVNNWAERR